MKKSYTIEGQQCKVEFDDAGNPRLYWNEEGSRVRWGDVPKEIKAELLEMIENGEEDVEIEEIKANVPAKEPEAIHNEIVPIPEATLEKTESDLTLTEIKKYICTNATDTEAYTFLKLCKARRLNPFTNEIYMVKFGNTAQTIVGKEAFTRRAEENKFFDGYQMTGTISLSSLFWRHPPIGQSLYCCER